MDEVIHILRVNAHVNMLQRYPVTEEMYEEYIKFFNTIRQNFTNFTHVNEEITDYQFRSSAVCAESHATLLEQDFDCTTYLYFLQAIQYMVKYVKADDDFVSMFNNVGVR